MKRQRRLNGVDEIVLSLYAKGLTIGEISAHFAEIFPRKREGPPGASVLKETISRITDKVLEEMQDWAACPLDEVYAAIFIDAIVVKVRDGQVTNRPICVIIAGVIAGRKNRSGGGFFLLGLLSPIIGVIVAILASPGSTPPPLGISAVMCPRCNANQNVPAHSHLHQHDVLGAAGHQ